MDGTRLPSGDATGTRAGLLDPASARARRRARVRLLRDLVSHGLYRVDTESLVDRLIERLDLSEDS